MEQLSLQICEPSPRNEGLAGILRQMISKPAKELIAEYKAEKKQNPNGDVLRPKLFVSIQRPEDADASPLLNQRKQLGRKIKNPVIGEKVVYFSLPEDCDVQSIKAIDKVRERLGKWRIQRRQRQTIMNDLVDDSNMICEYESPPSKRAREDEEKLAEDHNSQERLIMCERQPNLMDTSQESFENGMDFNLEISNFYMILKARTYEELAYVQSERDDFGLLPLFPSANDTGIGKDVEVLVTTEPAQALTLNEPNQKLPENFGPKNIETLKEALERLVDVELERVDI